MMTKGIPRVPDAIYFLTMAQTEVNKTPLLTKFRIVVAKRLKWRRFSIGTYRDIPGRTGTYQDDWYTLC